MSYQWNGFSKAELNDLTSTRKGEEKWGEQVAFFEQNQLDFEEFIVQSPAKFIILGAQECSGPVANHGLKGANKGFNSFLKSFLNIQVNRFFDIKLAALGGYFSFPFEEKTLEQHRDDVAIIDYHIYSKAKTVFKNGKIPILIGGGHNNAYPLIKAWFEATRKKLNILNLDPHADFRALEGRHSGNSFSYAMEEGMIDQYAVFGLQESYNNESMLSDLEETPGASWVSFEKILQNHYPQELFLRYIDRLQKRPTGLEIDMDVIAHMPVSAYTPSGFTLEETRRYLSVAAKTLALKYLHLPEAAPGNDREEKITGKALGFLVTDFMKHLK